VLLPSTYLIGNDGKPIDVVAGDIASAELISKVHDAVSVSLKFIVFLPNKFDLPTQKAYLW